MGTDSEKHNADCHWGKCAVRFSVVLLSQAALHTLPSQQRRTDTRKQMITSDDQRNKRTANTQQTKKPSKDENEDTSYQNRQLFVVGASVYTDLSYVQVTSNL